MSKLAEVFEQLGVTRVLSAGEVADEEGRAGILVPTPLRELVQLASGCELWRPGAEILNVFSVGLMADVARQLQGEPSCVGLTAFADDSGPSWFAVDPAGTVFELARGGGEPKAIAADVLGFFEHYLQHGKILRPGG